MYVSAIIDTGTRTATNGHNKNVFSVCNNMYIDISVIPVYRDGPFGL